MYSRNIPKQTIKTLRKVNFVYNILGSEPLNLKIALSKPMGLKLSFQ